MELVLAVLSASLLGSVHCAGMCGGFVCFYAGTAPNGAPEWRGHVAYHAGRLVAYLGIGALGGMLGARVEALGALAGVQRGAAVAAGALMIGWGLARVASALGVGLAHVGPPRGLRRGVSGALRRLAHRPLVVRSAALGLLTALLPCGWLWAFVVTAAGTGRPLAAMLVMATFWAGTLPMLTTLGVAVQRASGTLRKRLPVVSGAVMVALGMLALAGKMRMGPMGPHVGH